MFVHTVRYGALSFRRSDGNQIFYFIAFCSNQLILNRFFFSTFFFLSIVSLLISHSHSLVSADFRSQRHFSATDTALRTKWLNSIRSFWSMIVIIVTGIWPHPSIGRWCVPDAREHTQHTHSPNQFVRPVALRASERPMEWNTIDSKTVAKRDANWSLDKAQRDAQRNLCAWNM